jgi:YidC/Oxa1 family membrane protein insertase
MMVSIRNILSTLFFFLLSIQISSAYILENKKIKIEFDNKSSDISNWIILDKSLSLHHKLIEENISSFKLIGKINDIKLNDWIKKTNGWKKIQNPKNIIFELKDDKLPFELKKFWKFETDSYKVDFRIEILSKKKLEEIDLQLVLGPGIGEKFVEEFGISENIYSFTELIYKNDSIQTKRINSEKEVFEIDDYENLNWTGLHSRYFSFIIIPKKKFRNIQLFVNKEDVLSNTSLNSSLRLKLAIPSLEKNEKYENSFEIFGGPKTKKALAEFSLEDILFSSLWTWMRWLILLVMSILYFINNYFLNWGISIIVLAIIVRIIIYPLANKAIISQKRFTKINNIIQPQISEIKMNYKGGEQSERILKIYEKYNISPLEGLKPLATVAIQIPIFIALFHLLGQAFEFQYSSFLWIESLAEPDKFLKLKTNLPFFGSYINLLPFLMSLTNLLSIKIGSMQKTSDNKNSIGQITILCLMTLGFFLLFYSFPSGMVLYWTMSNILHLIHILLTKTR